MSHLGGGNFLCRAMDLSTFPYVYAWGNNSKRASLKGRRFRIIARGSMNSALAEFENGQREIISRNAVRRVKP